MRRLAAVALVLVLTGCSAMPSAYDLPLPGGADLGDRPYRVTVEFDDVLDLVPHAGVKVDDVAVGKVEDIALSEDGTTALVRVAVRGDVLLPSNALARLRQSSLLGEKYVELAVPAQRSASPLVDGAVIPVTRTNRNPEVEEVFGALSMLLNGGGIAQIQDISRELSAALSGNEAAVRSLLSTLDSFVGEMDSHRGEITRALEGMDELASSLESRKEDIGEVLDGLEPGLRVLHEQRGQLVGLLDALRGLSDVAVSTVNRSRDDLVADLRALEPTLRRLAESGQNLPQSLEMLLTFPFTDAVLDGIKGDYLNTYLTLKPGAR
ncbi:phospholipid/cholesterol/gamma-HCH transport system substrate-binding protein [Saccharothrix saharensis]|uniref:Phospholipid/cholesterol/gamma-HCH transport system substrate-binding protein n=1 Tax=Saccharothrix saharensis TaxID=571190 RepID=A0A543JPF6_9PSEU|nr:MCE family protein [Saccharothrix saharensis]TQM84719.1 phospholipid/cholesterol/gamma-HCH transport system substrate-binding protein [Saccharothrix saharensis]